MLVELAVEQSTLKGKKSCKEGEIMPYGKGTYGKKVGRPKKKKTKKRKK